MARTLSILGSTGSIGTQTLDVVRSHPGEYRVIGLSAHKNIEALAEQILEFKPQLAAVATPDAARALTALVGVSNTHIVHGVEGYETVAAANEACTVVVATVGSCGLRPSFAAIRAGKDVAL